MNEKPFKLKGVADFVIARVERLQVLTGFTGKQEISVFIQQAFDEWDERQEAQEPTETTKLQHYGREVTVRVKKRIVSVAVRAKFINPEPNTEN